MNCCLDCFTSTYVRSIISTNSTITGECDYCKSRDVRLYDPVALVDIFRNLIESYKPVVGMVPGITPASIENKLLFDFESKIFSSSKENEVRTLLEAIFANELKSYIEIFTQPVYLECYLDPDAATNLNILQITWDRFVREIRNENRYHISNVMDLKKLEVLLGRYVKDSRKGKIFYRARISEKRGFSLHEMHNPPANLAKAGRANPPGISYLYLSSDAETTLYETRALLFDYVSIGEFKLLEDIKVVSLVNAHSFDPVQLAESDQLSDFLIYLPFVNSLEKELSKPLRRSDNELDYIPTQYISEFIKSLKFHGVEFRSSLNPRGYNIAVFHPTKFECVKVSVQEVQDIRFKYIGV